jgi:hypothetical protein
MIDAGPESTAPQREERELPIARGQSDFSFGAC